MCISTSNDFGKTIKYFIPQHSTFYMMFFAYLW